MTIEETLRHRLDNCAVPTLAIDEIMAKVKEFTDSSMNNRWNNQVEDCPTQVLTLLWYSTKQEAIAWAKENSPDAFWLPLLDEIVTKENKQ